MKKVKTAIWVIAFGLISLVVFQNWGYFNEKHALSLNLYFGRYSTSDFTNLFLFLGCFLIGLLISYFYGRIERFKYKRLIKKLNETTAAQHEEISGLKQELEMMQKNTTDTHLN